MRISTGKRRQERKSFQITVHQAQRRGIDRELLDLVLHYGHEIKGTGGTRFYRIPYKELPFLAEECPPMFWRRYRDRLRRIASLLVRPVT